MTDAPEPLPEARADDARVELVRRTAALCRIAITDEEARELGPQFDRILDAFEGLAALDVEGVEPMTRPIELPLAVREDVPGETLPVDALLSNAPRREDGFYSVPKTLDAEA